MGQGGGHLQASIHRLETLGLLTWSRTKLTFATSITDLRGHLDPTGFHTMYAVLPNHARRVPVPRQTIRLIAGGCRATVIATMLGHLCRCLYYREHCCISGGWCKASWIAEVFRMDLRGCGAGFGLALKPYNAGCSDDVLAVLQAIIDWGPGSPISLFGFSLGGNIVLKLLGESPDRLPSELARAAAVNPSTPSSSCSASSSRPTWSPKFEPYRACCAPAPFWP